MVFAIDPETRRLVASLPSSEGVEKFDCVGDVCGNPVCRCQTVRLTLRAHPSGSRAEPPMECKVSLDVGAKAVDEKFRKSAAPKDVAFSEALLAAMEPIDFQFLMKLHHMLKNRITEAAKPVEIKAQFDFDAIEKSSMMQGYNDILPCGDQLQLTIEGVDYIAMDVYCVRPGCRCSDAHIDLLPVDDAGQLGESVGMLELDYASQRWEAGANLAPPCDPAILRPEIEKAIPDLYKKLLARHEKLRAIYAHCRKRELAALAEVMTSAPVGRNDPCPCGSSRKFKKCCMGKIARWAPAQGHSANPGKVGSVGVAARRVQGSV